MATTTPATAPTAAHNLSPESRNTSSDSSRFSDVLKAKPAARDDGSQTPDRDVSPKRLKTFLRSFKHIYNLSPKEVDDFMASYEIYNLDWADEDAMVAALGPDYQRRVGDCLRSYYGVMNHLCSLGDVEKMYIPPLMNEKASVLDNQLLFEESVARDLDLRKGSRVLDLGCGRGRVAAHMSHYSGAQVIGMNIDENQIAQARAFNAEQNLPNEFVVHDQNELPLPFPDAHFDAFYEIQALSLCRDPQTLFSEIHRVLKPGARFLLLDWVSLPAYQPEKHPEQAELMRRVKPLIGAVGTPTPASLEADLAAAGFRSPVDRSDNPSLGGLQAPLIDKVDVYFRTLRRLIHGMVKVRALPPHFRTLMDRLCLDGQAFVEMDQQRLITTTYRIMATKPSESETEVRE